MLVGVLLLLFAGCTGKDPLEEKLLGSWRSARPHQEFTLVFMPGHSWEYHVRIGTRHTRPAAPENTLSGKWTSEAGRLRLRVDHAVGGADQLAGEVLTFRIQVITPNRLVLEKEDGAQVKYLRIPGSGPDTSGAAHSMRLPPLAVNLALPHADEPERYLCLALTLIGDGKSPIEAIHPKVHESLIFFLSSQPYEAVNTFAKLYQMEGRLYEIIRPYLSGAVSGVRITDAFTTSDPAKVERFLHPADKGIFANG